MNIKTEVIKDSDILKTTAVTVWTDNDKDIIFYVQKSSETARGFLNLGEKQKFKKESIEKLAGAWDFFHNAQEGDYELKLINPFLKGKDFIHCQFNKTKTDNQYLILGQTLKRNGGANSNIEIIIDINPEPKIFKITVELGGGKKVIVTEKPR